MAKHNSITIEVRNGCVIAVYADDPQPIQAFILDLDGDENSPQEIEIEHSDILKKEGV